jgi:hypothetical protein
MPPAVPSSTHSGIPSTRHGKDPLILGRGGGGEAFRDKSDPASGCKKLKKSARKRKGR